MKKLIQIHLAVLVIILTACNENPDTIEAKKEKLQEYRDEMNTLRTKISDLEKEIREEDPDFTNGGQSATLVSTITVQPQKFEHKIDVRGSVESRKNVLISAESAGRIEKITVTEGDQVKKGQLLLVVDAETLKNTVAELKTSLELAKTRYERQSRLWEQKIGTEMQYLEAKNNKESLERKLATAHSQLDMASIKAPFSGIIDEVHVKLGEMVQPGTPLFRILSLDEMHVEAEVSERYLGKVQKGDEVQVYFPAMDKTIDSKIIAVGQVINELNRTFSVEVALNDKDKTIKPNQVVVLKIQDYINEDALVVPNYLVQKDNKGDYVYVVDQKKENPAAKKVHVKTGLTYNNKSEITDGLEPNSVLVDKGYREITDGVNVRLAEKTATQSKNASTYGN